MIHEMPFVFETGPMGSGKTFELIVKAYQAAEESRRVVCLQSALNTRDEGMIKSRAGLNHPATVVEPNFTRASLVELLRDADFIGVDEIHLFRDEIIDILFNLYKDGKQIVVAGIDTDYRGDILDMASNLMRIPEVRVVKHTTICAVCGKRNAHRSQRLRNGSPVSRKEPTVLIEGSDDGVTYRAVCVAHHQLLD